jgi:eukaryotic-like serine/threonine-protein kinase
MPLKESEMNAGQTLGRYKIIRQLGKGGMGEVYLASDSELDRQVAIKVLPEDLRSDPERLARFRREAKAAASLNHPNIATIHSIEKDGDIHFIVMEYVDGETLFDRIPSSGIELDAFFKTFIPLSDALAHAHDQGRIHRDIKPGNIMVDAKGTPKILDFGLARIVTGTLAAGSEDPTMTIGKEDSNITKGQMLLGTPKYMSPEQAQQKSIDTRTDLFSLGVVMYEALTGKQPFDGDSTASIMGKLLETDPEPVTALKPVTPHQLWWVIRKCLVKDCEERYQLAREIRTDLRGVQKELTEGIVYADVNSLCAGDAPPLCKFHIPVSQRIDITAYFSGAQISPDGTMLVYIDEDYLWVREFAQLEARKISDSNGAINPFWSPDSQMIGYFTNQALRTVALRGGPSTTLCAISSPVYGGTWGADNTVVFSQQIRGSYHGLFAVSATGGEPTPLLAPDIRNYTGFYFPHFLPNGRALLFLQLDHSVVPSLVVHDSGTQTIVAKGNEAQDVILHPFYAQSGHLFYSRKDSFGDWKIWAAPLAITDLSTVGKPFIVANHANVPSVSKDGTLAYMDDSGITKGEYLTWVGRTGLEVQKIEPPRERFIQSSLSVSRDEKYVAFSTGNQIWIYDMGRGTQTPLDGSLCQQPCWSPDGESLAFCMTIDKANCLCTQNIGSGEEPRIYQLDTPDVGAPAWSHDGQVLTYHVNDREGGRELWYVSKSDDSDARPFLQTSHQEVTPVLSPNGKFIAYSSDEAGQYDVYVQPFPDGGRKWRISTDGGFHPRWSHCGDELFYVEENTLFSVEVNTEDRFAPGPPQRLFEGATANIRFRLPGDDPPRYYRYDVSSDSNRFLVIQEEKSETAQSVIIVQNWYSEFKDSN